MSSLAAGGGMFKALLEEREIILDTMNNCLEMSEAQSTTILMKSISLDNFM